MIEHAILANLCLQPRFVHSVLPHLEADFFQGVGEKAIFLLIKKHVAKFRKLPSFYALSVELQQTTLTENVHKSASEVVRDLEQNHATPADLDWLINASEQWAKKLKTWTTLQKSIMLAEKDGSSTDSLQKILALMRDAAGYGFKSNLCHDYFGNASERWDYYHAELSRIPFELETFNQVTDGGFGRGTLNIFLAGLHIGKTMTMCSFAASNLRLGHKVLYVTLEMKEQEIAARIDANVLDIGLDNIRHIPKDDFLRRAEDAKKRCGGVIKVRQFPGRSASAETIRHLLGELELKERFVPDIIYVDYLGLLSSSNLLGRDASDTYNYMGSVAVELRAIAQEKDVAIVTGAQLRRDEYNTPDFDVTGTGGSWQLPQHADGFYGLATTPELRAVGQIRINHLKSRYTDCNKTPVFYMGIDYNMQRFYDLEEDSRWGSRQ